MSGFINNDYYIFSSFQEPKQPNTYLTLLEETERYERIRSTVDPVMMATLAKVQAELLSKVSTKAVSLFLLIFHLNFIWFSTIMFLSIFLILI